MTSENWKLTAPVRSYAPGIGEAVADRTINRKKGDGSIETWPEVAFRVAMGNVTLRPDDAPFEFEPLHRHLKQASILMSGRHLQHGDFTQSTRPQEVFTNCSTSASTFLLFYLLLNGSGVGRCYDDDMMLVDWAGKMPTVVPLIRADHPDVLSGEIGQEFVDPEQLKGKEFDRVVVFEVPDSREGWAKAFEQVEYLTWKGDAWNSLLMVDFSHVRHRGQPINGMQKRPASGPGPMMNAMRSIASLRGNGMQPWRATLQADHYAAECVLVGGARRAARMSTKTWRDKSVLDFVNVKRDGGLWSSNNSVTVDEEFWRYVKGDPGARGMEALAAHARQVFEAICSASYHDGTGEPGIINVDKLVSKDDGLELLFDGDYAESDRFKLDDQTKEMTAALARVFSQKKYPMITNPCGEIALSLIGGYCVIADVVPFHAGRMRAEIPGAMMTRDGLREWDNDAEEAFRVTARALIRTNTMNCLYSKEVKRTNRIGVGITGFHEYAWSRFGYGWKDLVDEAKSIDFWRTLSRFSNAVVDEAVKYSALLGLATPHTALTMKPAGTTSKLFGLTEGAHLATMRHYLRWVQYRSDDPLLAEFRRRGYPVRDLVSYTGTTIVGFPTVPLIATLGMGDKLVTASEATPEEQYEFLRLLEKWWINGHEEAVRGGDLCVGGHSMGNQVSYTLKYKPELVGYENFREAMIDGQSTIRACSVMPHGDMTKYEYQPEEPVSIERFNEIVAAINAGGAVKEDIGLEHVDCAGGACPINFNDEKVQ